MHLVIGASQVRFRTLWPRFCAGFVDGVLVGLPFYLLERLAARWTSVPALVGVSLAGAVAGACYDILLTGRYGQTVGKRLLRVKVVDLSERRVTMRQAVLRATPYLLLSGLAVALELACIARSVNPFANGPFLPLPDPGWAKALAVAQVLVVGADAVVVLFSERRRALHDVIAGTVVVRLDA